MDSLFLCWWTPLAAAAAAAANKNSKQDRSRYSIQAPVICHRRLVYSACLVDIIITIIIIM